MKGTKKTMDVKNKSPQQAHVATLTKSLISKLPFSFFRYPSIVLLSFLLARSNFLGASAPFGLASVAALGAGKYSLFGLLGAILGYISVSEKINSLKYIACIILIFTAHFVFSGTSLPKKKLFTPLTVIIPTLCINFVFLADGGFNLFDTALSIFEVIVAAIGATLLSYILSPARGNPVQSLSALATLAVGITSALSGISLWGLISPGRVLAFLLVSLCAFSGGVGAGAASGLLLGSAVSLTLITPEYAIVFGACGILIATFARYGRVLSLLVSFALSSCICACLDTSLTFSFLIEFALAAPLAFALENTFKRKTRLFFAKNNERKDIHLRRYVSERLNFAATAFKNLGATLSEVHVGKETKNLNDVRSYFEKSSQSLCKKCSLRSICWDRDFQSTRDAFTKAGNAITKNGALTARDFPVYFSSRCLNTENFVNSVNREIFAIRYRSKAYEEQSEYRKLIKRQYSDVAAVFEDISLDISNNTRFDEYAEAELHGELIRRGILCDAAVYRDSENHINIHICGRDLADVIKNYDELLPIFSRICNVHLGEPKYSASKELDDILIRELPYLRAVFGASAKSRSTSEQNGDSGALFYPSNGHLALLLSDGMGSGRLAAKESAKSINLLAELLRSGLSPKDALSTLQSALTLRSEITGSFATLDLLSANLFTGEAKVYKLGGAPTYIKREKTVRRICSSSLPAGITLGEKCEPDVTPLTLEVGDYVIMTSDGIAEGSDDVKLLEFLSDAEPASPKALADELLAFSLAHYKKNDDMTVAVIRIENAY